MYNSLYIDIAALIVFITLIFSSIFNKTLKGNANRVFLLAVFTSTLTTIFRIISISICLTANVTNAKLAAVFGFSTCYYILQSFIMPIGVMYIYVSLGIIQLLRKNYFLKITMVFITFLPSVLFLINIFTKNLFYIESNLTIQVNKAFLIVNLCTLFVILIGFISIIVYRRFFKQIKFKIAIFLYPLNLTFMILQHFYPHSELLMFIIAITCYLLSTTTQGSELIMNPIVHCGSSYSFYENARKSFLVKKDVVYIFVKIANYKNIRLYVGQISYATFLNILVKKINAILKKSQVHANVFYLDNCLFAIPVEKPVEKNLLNFCSDLTRELKQKISYEGFEINLDSRIAFIEAPADVSDYEYLHYFSKNFHHVFPNENKVFFMRDYKKLPEFKMKNNIEKILENALIEDKFELFYHPVFGVEDNRYVSCEALLRLKDDDFGYIPPAVFISNAEKNGKIHQIGDIVFKKAMKFIASDTFKKLNLNYVEINLSSYQCVEPDLVDKVKGWLKEYNVSPDLIRLEITENAVDINPQIVEKNILGLYELGIHFALDDYGTGYSNIKKVLSLPIDVVKLDKTFVDEINNEQLNIVITDTIEMMKSLKKKVHVEGIESREAVDHFKSLEYKTDHACDYIQGYYFTKPLPEKEFVEFIIKG